MTIQIVVTYTKTKIVEVPEELAATDALGEHDFGEKFDAWVAEQADTAMGEEPLKWARTTAFDVASREMVYDVS